MPKTKGLRTVMRPIPRGFRERKKGEQGNDAPTRLRVSHIANVRPKNKNAALLHIKYKCSTVALSIEEIRL